MKKKLFLIYLMLFPIPGLSQTRDAFIRRSNAASEAYRSARVEERNDFLSRSWQAYAAISGMEDPFSKRGDAGLPQGEKPGKDTSDSAGDRIVFPAKTIPDGPLPAGLFAFGFYGRQYRVHYDRKDDFLLVGIASRDVAAMWDTLEAGPVASLSRECVQIREKEQLCDWAFLQMVDSLSMAIYPARPCEREMLFGFLLGQAGYQVRFGTSGRTLSCLYNTLQIIYAKSYFPGDGDSYWYTHVPGEGAWSLSDPCPGRSLDLTLKALPEVDGPVRMRHVSTAGVEFDWRIPQALLDFYASYPHTEMAVKADAPVSQAFREAAYPALKAAMAGKGEVESVNLLLRFVWGVMTYRTDRQHWGYEKWCFPEESCFYQVGDCDDHAILFCRLVRDLLGLDVLLVECDVDGGPHAAAAVRFNEALEGDSLSYEGQRYFCCEPTSNHARAGQRIWKKFEVTKIDSVM